MNDLNGKKRIKTAVLGATGMVGQVFVSLLTDHPFFELTVLASSGARVGKRYGDEVHWTLPAPLPEAAAQATLSPLDIDTLEKAGVKIVFSALPADVAQELEPKLRERNFYVFSNASAMRYDPNVPILIPDANPESLQWIEKQGYPESGFVVTNANCTTTGLAVALAPLRIFNIREVFVSTYQSISGAGYPGLSALDIHANTIPYIHKEEEKVIAELKKILSIEPDVYPHCIRVPVPFGHLETVWVTFEKTTTVQDVINAWNAFETDNTNLPSLPRHPVVFSEQNDFPQHRFSFWGNPPGMQVFTGRLRQVKDKIGFSLLVNNIVKGAAGGSIANAELFVSQYGKNL